MVGKISAEGLHGQFDFITMATDDSITFDGRDVAMGTAKAGAPVGLVGLMRVGLITSGAPYGVLVRVEPDGTALIGKGGVQEFKIGETAPEAGDAIVAAAGNTIAAGADGAGVGTVVDVNEAKGIAWVDLG